MIPYGRQIIDDDDIAEVVKVLKSDMLTTGPAVKKFEDRVASYTGSAEAVALSSGTAALHAAIFALGIGPGDEVIVPAITFAASANCIIYCGGTPALVDVDPRTLLIDPQSVRERITERTRAVVAVDYAGQTCDYAELQKICRAHSLHLVGDCCHSIGAKNEQGLNAGTMADLSVLSFHPVKHITTGEGGMVLTDNAGYATKIRSFRNHGINLDAAARSRECTWVYEMDELGYNYRITDIQCALGISQLKKLDRFIDARQKLAAGYDTFFSSLPEVTPLFRKQGVAHAYHLYVVKIPAHKRKHVFEYMRGEGIGVNVHYIPVHYHPYYQKKYGTGKGQCPNAEAAYEQLLTLPLHPAMNRNDVEMISRKLEQGLNTCP